MFRKQIATSKINSNKNLSKYADFILEVASSASDPEDFYEWLSNASEAEIIDWTEDAQLRDEFGYLDNEVDRERWR